MARKIELTDGITVPVVAVSGGVRGAAKSSLPLIDASGALLLAGSEAAPHYHGGVIADINAQLLEAAIKEGCAFNTAMHGLRCEDAQGALFFTRPKDVASGTVLVYAARSTGGAMTSEEHDNMKRALAEGVGGDASMWLVRPDGGGETKAKCVYVTAPAGGIADGAALFALIRQRGWGNKTRVNKVKV